MGLKILPAKSGEILLEIIIRRYENRSTMMTSNRPVEEWGKLLCDVPAASAILDRLTHHAEIIAITGRSYRLKERAAEQNQRQASHPKQEKKQHRHANRSGNHGSPNPSSKGNSQGMPLLHPISKNPAQSLPRVTRQV